MNPSGQPVPTEEPVEPIEEPVILPVDEPVIVPVDEPVIVPVDEPVVGDSGTAISRR